jgi:hypothetical protein
MHILNPTERLLILAFLAIVAVAIMISSLQGTRAVYGTKGLTSVQTGVQGQFLSTWQRLKSTSETQIRDNDKRISTLRAQKVGASRIFRETYDSRVAELERRNAALEAKLHDYTGEREDTLAASK